MKKIITAVFLSAFLALSVSGKEIKLAIVAMDKIYESFYKQQEGAKKIQSAFEKAQEQAAAYVTEGKAMVEELKSLEEQIGNAALTDEAKKDLQVKREEKGKAIQAKEAELQQWQREMQQSLQQRQQQFRQDIIEEIKKVVKTEADKVGATLVLDTADVLNSGVPPVLFADPEWDITQTVIKELNKAAPQN